MAVGLYLEVLPSGSRIWRLKYRHGGRESRATFGHFPEVGLAEARRRRDEAREHLRDGTAPNAAKAAKAEAAKRVTGAAFPIVAAAWLKKMEPDWAEATRRKAAYIANTYLVPKLRHTSVTTLTPIPRTLPSKLIMSREECHGTTKKVQCGVQA